jgi:hypothetical protein
MWERPVPYTHRMPGRPPNANRIRKRHVSVLTRRQIREAKRPSPLRRCSPTGRAPFLPSLRQVSIEGIAERSLVQTQGAEVTARVAH